jgi:hypothetical protein
LAFSFSFRDLALPPEYLIVGLAALAFGGSLWRRSLLGERIATLLVPLAALGGGAWYALAPGRALVAGVLLAGAAGLVHTALHYRRALAEGRTREAGQMWVGFVVAAAVASWVAYHQVFTLWLFAETPLRRLVLTLGWLGAGLVGMVAGLHRGERPLRDGGALLVALAVGKALAYDTTHLQGWARVALCGAAGLALLAGARLSRDGAAPDPRGEV